MVEFLINIGDPSGKTEHKKISDEQATALIGMQVGSEVDGSLIGYDGEKFIITGGSDKDGFPMRRDLPGPGRKKLYIAESTGFRAKRKGERARKTVRGNTISDDIAQINMRRITPAKEV